jgi:hypothetical protein
MSTYQTTVSNSSETLAVWKSWAQTFSVALAAFGWTQVPNTNLGAQGQVDWTNVMLPWTGQSNSAVGTQSLPTISGGQFSVSPNFTGAYSTAHGAYSTGDVVTDSGTTYYCIAGYTPTSGASSIPQWDKTHWVNWSYEVWQTPAGTLQTDTPLYLRLEYGINTNSAGGGFAPYMRISAGTSVNSSGLLVVTGNHKRTPIVAVPTSVSLAVTLPTVPALCSFSGDAGNRFAVMMMHDLEDRTDLSDHGAWAFVIERSLDNTGAYSHDYYTVLVAGFTGAVSQCSIVRTGALNWVSTTEDTKWTTIAASGLNTTGEIVPDGFYNQGTGSSSAPGSAAPVFPVWPLVGWVGNPMTAVVTFKGTIAASLAQRNGCDAPPGRFTTTMYGTTRTYLGCRNNDFSAIGQGSSTDTAIAIRFD